MVVADRFGSVTGFWADREEFRIIVTYARKSTPAVVTEIPHQSRLPPTPVKSRANVWTMPEMAMPTPKPLYQVSSLVMDLVK